VVRRSARLALGAVAALVLASVPAAAHAHDNDEVRGSGSCSNGADWEVRARSDDDNRIEFRGQVDHTRSGQVWAWKIKHNGSVSASGRAVARGGQIEVERALVDLAGVDRCTFRAVRVKTGEVCRGTVDW
jgi:hypothetical protein